MTSLQKLTFRDLIRGLGPEWFHHGDCIGSDADAHDVVVLEIAFGLVPTKIIGHPPTTDTERHTVLRAYKDCYELREQKPHIERNHNIVDESGLLIATPSSSTEQVRSGTWATVRYARLQFKPVYFILPNGELFREKNTPPGNTLFPG
jgi:hypothetical protein